MAFSHYLCLTDNLTSIRRKFMESLHAVMSFQTKWTVLIRAQFWALCSLRVSLLFFHSLSLQIVIQKESSINASLANSCLFLLSRTPVYVSLWPVSPLCTTLQAFYRLPDRTVTSGTGGLSVVIVVTGRAADTLFVFCQKEDRSTEIDGQFDPLIKVQVQ